MRGTIWKSSLCRRPWHDQALRPLNAPSAGSHWARKNWLFARSDTDGESATAIRSLIEPCKLNGIDPEAYLRSVLARTANLPIRNVAEHLP